MHRRMLLVAGCLGLAACSTTTASLPYMAPSSTPIFPGAPVIGSVNVTDARGEQDPNWIGAVRGGYGNPLKVLRTDRPVADVVADAFRAALSARGMLAQDSGPLALNVTVITFKCDQVVRREAQVELGIVVTERATGREIYRDMASSDVVTGSVVALDTGIFGSTEDLRQVAITAMNQAINQALDKPGFPAHRSA